MAGNNGIQILRGTTENISASSQKLLSGQMLYNLDKNYLTVGAQDGDALTKKPVAARELVWYANDTDDAIGNMILEDGYIRKNGTSIDIIGVGSTAINMYSGGFSNINSLSLNIIGQTGLNIVSGATVNVNAVKLDVDSLCYLNKTVTFNAPTNLVHTSDGSTLTINSNSTFTAFGCGGTIIGTNDSNTTIYGNDLTAIGNGSVNISTTGSLELNSNTFANVVGNIGTYIRGGSVQIRPDEGVYIVPSTGGSISIGVSNINMSNANITLNASNRKVDLFAGSTSSNTSLYMDSGGMNIDARSVPLRINANSSNVLVNVTNGAIQMSGGGVYLNASSMVNINGSNGVCIYAQNNGVRIGSSIDSSYYYLPGEPGTIGQVLMSGGANSVCSWWTPFQTRYYDSPRSESNFSLGDFRLVKFRSALTEYPHLTVAICGKVVSISGDCNIRVSGNLVRDTQYSLCMIFGDYMIPYGNIVYGSFHFDGGIVGTLRARGYSSSNQTDLEFSVADYDNGEGKKGNAYCVFNITYIAE